MSWYYHNFKVISPVWLIHLCPLLTHWGRVTHICVGKLTIIGSDNGLSPGRRQAIIWTNDGILLIGPLGTNFNEISIGIQTFSFKKMHFKMSSAKWRPFCLGLNVLKIYVKISLKLELSVSVASSPFLFIFGTLILHPICILIYSLFPSLYIFIYITLE